MQTFKWRRIASIWKDINAFNLIRKCFASLTDDKRVVCLLMIEKKKHAHLFELMNNI